MTEFSSLKAELEREEVRTTFTRERRSRRRPDERVPPQKVQKTLQSRINIKETAEIKVEIGERRDAKNLVKRGRNGSDDGGERKQPPRRRVASAKAEELKDANETGKTNPKTREPQRDKEPVQRGRGTPQQPRTRVRKAAVSLSSMVQPQAEGADPNAGLRRSKRIANRK